MLVLSEGHLFLINLTVRIGALCYISSIYCKLVVTIMCDSSISCTPIITDVESNLLRDSSFFVFVEEDGCSLVLMLIVSIASLFLLEPLDGIY